VSAPPAPQPVLPDSVRLWRGYIAPGMAYADFARFLGTVFIPSGALLQPRAGLCAFLPTMTAQDAKPATVPDQTALMWWVTPEAHDAAPRTQAVRAYQSLHGGAYDTTRSSSQPPVPFDGAVAAEQPYHLFSTEADWMLGTVRHFVGGRPDSTPAEPDWLAVVADWASGYAGSPPAGVDGALLCAGDGYVTFWEHYADAQAAPGSALDELGRLATPFLSKTAEPVTPGGGLWDDWPGWTELSEGDCWNVQLDRPAPS
jgi:hypothetical protein